MVPFKLTGTITVKDADDTDLESATYPLVTIRKDEDVLSFTSVVGIDYIWDNVNGILNLFNTSSMDELPGRPAQRYL